jgi:hypothetical protein
MNSQEYSKISHWWLITGSVKINNFYLTLGPLAYKTKINHIHSDDETITLPKVNLLSHGEINRPLKAKTIFYRNKTSNSGFGFKQIFSFKNFEKITKVFERNLDSVHVFFGRITINFRSNGEKGQGKLLSENFPLLSDQFKQKTRFNKCNYSLMVYH